MSFTGDCFNTASKVLDTILLHDADRNPDLMLVQAVIFARSLYIEQKCLYATGLRAQGSAQKTFHQRACPIYE
jgi:hypothetical protein